MTVTLTGLIATFYLFRIKGQWEEMAVWQAAATQMRWQNILTFLPHLLRARAEVRRHPRDDRTLQIQPGANWKTGAGDFPVTSAG